MLRPLVRPLVRALTRSPMESRGLRPTLSLDFTNGGVTDSRVTYSGGANGTRVNSAGLIVAATTPRFDYNPVTLTAMGLWVEEPRTNLLVNSLINGTILGTQSVTVAATPYTLSFYGTGTVTLSGVSTAGPAVGSAAYPTRTTLTFTPTAGSLTLTVAGTVQFAQLEAGSFATSFIPTAGVTVTRSADSAVMTGTNFSSWYNQAGGSAVVQFDLIAVSGTRPIISFDDNTANERIELYATGTDLRMKVTDGGATQVDMSIGTVAANTTYKAAIAWAANDFAGCLNGGTVATDSSGALPTPDRLRIGSDQAGNFQCGHDKTLQAFALRLPNATLQGMTA